jgi:hypothetical protein
MAEAAVRGKPRQPSLDQDGSTSRPGIGVDAQGGQVVDPTKNVEDLVKSLEYKLDEFRASDYRYVDSQISWLEKTANFTREADMRLNTFAREAADRMQTALRHAETTRTNELASTRKEYENTIRDMLAKSVETTSTLVSTQLVQIQATFDKRVSQLEAYQFTQAGRSSVADPALADALRALAQGQKQERSALDDALSKMTNALATMQQSQSAAGGSATGKADAAATQRANISLYIAIGVALIVLFTFLRGTPAVLEPKPSKSLMNYTEGVVAAPTTRSFIEKGSNNRNCDTLNV